MDVRIQDLMRPNVIFVTEETRVGHLKTLFKNNKISTLPVVNADEEVVGIVSSKDLVKNECDDHDLAGKIMTKGVFSIPSYDKPETAARMMRNQKIHHLVVTHEKKLVGIISSFDLLKLIEGHRYVEKKGSTPKKSRGKNKEASA